MPSGEFAMNGHKNSWFTTGALSLWRSQLPNSAGSQFFITVADAPHLDGQYATFGIVIEGMDVADRIVKTERDRSDRPGRPANQKVTVEKFGADYDPPEKV